MLFIRPTFRQYTGGYWLNPNYNGNYPVMRTIIMIGYTTSWYGIESAPVRYMYYVMIPYVVSGLYIHKAKVSSAQVHFLIHNIVSSRMY